MDIKDLFKDENKDSKAIIAEFKSKINIEASEIGVFKNN